MKTERLLNVPIEEAGDFYYLHLKLPYANTAPGEDTLHESDPTIADFMDIAADSGRQLGFVILRTDDTLEIIDTCTGERIRLTLAEGRAEVSVQKPADLLAQVALTESKSVSTSLLELINYLEQHEVLAALGTFQIFCEKFNFLGTLLQAAARISQKT